MAYYCDLTNSFSEQQAQSIDISANAWGLCSCVKGEG